MCRHSYFCLLDVPVSVMHVIFSSSSVASSTFSALCTCYACIQSSGIILTPKATFVPNFVSVMPSIAELAHGEKSHTQSLTHPAYLTCRELTLSLRNITLYCMAAVQLIINCIQQNIMKEPWTANRSSSFVHFPFSFRPLCNTQTFRFNLTQRQLHITQKYVNIHSQCTWNKNATNLLNSECSNTDSRFFLTHTQLLLVILYLQQSPTKWVINSMIYSYLADYPTAKIKLNINMVTRQVAIITMYCNLRLPDANHTIAFLTKHILGLRIWVR